MSNNFHISFQRTQDLDRNLTPISVTYYIVAYDDHNSVTVDCVTIDTKLW